MNNYFCFYGSTLESETIHQTQMKNSVNTIKHHETQTPSIVEDTKWFLLADIMWFPSAGRI